MTRLPCCREPFSGFSHLFGAILAGVGLVVLVHHTHDDPAKMLSMIVYGGSAILLYLASAALHLVRAPDRVMLWLKRCDHAAIHLMIAGTYTPFTVSLLAGRWRWGLLGIVWAVALVSVAFKLAFHRRSTRQGMLMYMGAGWLGVITAPQVVRSLPPGGIALLLAGGAVYCLGALAYLVDDPRHRPRYFNWHDVWHICVLGASALHFAAILVYVA